MYFFTLLYIALATYYMLEKLFADAIGRGVCAEMLTFATRNPFDCCGECTLVQKNPFLAQAYKKDYSRCIFSEKEQQQLQKTRVSCCILLEMPLVQACRFAFCEKTQADKNSRKSKLKQIFAKNSSKW